MFTNFSLLRISQCLKGSNVPMEDVYHLKYELPIYHRFNVCFPGLTDWFLFIQKRCR